MDQNVESGIPVENTEDLSTRLHRVLTIIFTYDRLIILFNRVYVPFSTTSDSTLTSLDGIGPRINRMIHTVLNHWFPETATPIFPPRRATSSAVNESSSLLARDDPTADDNNDDSPITEQPHDDLHSVNISDENSAQIRNNDVVIDIDNTPPLPESRRILNIKLSTSTIMTIFYLIPILIKLISSNFAVLFCTLILYFAFTSANYDLKNRIENNPFERKKLYFIILYILSILGIFIFILDIYPDFYYKNEYYYFSDTILITLIFDLQVKIFTVFLKTIITCLPANFCTKGVCYQLIESISQLYRVTLPIYPWVFYILKSGNAYDPEHDGLTWKLAFATISLILYLSIKVGNIILCGHFCVKSLFELFENMSCRRLSSNEERSILWDKCPICLEENKYLFLSSCQHKFCYACIFKWTNEEGSNCPLCRKSITVEYQNGFTSDFIQIF